MTKSKYEIFYKDETGSLCSFPAGVTRDEAEFFLKLEQTRHKDAYILSVSQIKKMIAKEAEEFKARGYK